MFTGLIQHVGNIVGIQAGAGDAQLRIDIGPLAAGAKLGDSIAVDGCCLTVTALSGTVASFDAVPETLRRTTLGDRAAGDRVNLEESLSAGAKLGGHFVQGHVDTTARVEQVKQGGRWAEWHFKLADAALAEHIVEKGSIAIDGISLTVAGCDPRAATFWVALIPETLARTTIATKERGARVNIETDILGKYVLHALHARLGAGKPFSFDEQRLRENGF